MGMAQLNVKMTTTVSRDTLLATLKENREQHAKIVKEAQEGYLKDAIARSTRCLEALKRGEMVSLSKFATHTPVSYDSAYATCILMLEMSVDDTVMLSADEFRQFVQDQWNWKDGFLQSNSSYSGTAMIMSQNIDSNNGY